MKKQIIVVFVVFAMLFSAIGYAQLTDMLSISGSASASPPEYDVYISAVSPETSSGVSVTSYSSTVLMMSVDGAGVATFNITVKNQSSLIYVYERIITGAELALEGVYDGDEITQSVSITPLTEIAAGGSLDFTLTVNVPGGITAGTFILKFNFMEKGSSGILPGGPTTPTPDPDPDPDPNPDPDPDPEPDPEPEYNEDFLGLVEAVLSNGEDCLNDPGSTLIFNAVQEAINGKGRGDDPPILHCLVNSIKGGTMTSVTNKVNENLSADLHFVFEADLDDENRMTMYMYYKKDIDAVEDGERILVYRQVVRRNTATGLWDEDGTYIGSAVVGYFYDGGNGNNSKSRTINVYTWTAGAPEGAA